MGLLPKVATPQQWFADKSEYSGAVLRQSFLPHVHIPMGFES